MENLLSYNESIGIIKKVVGIRGLWREPIYKFSLQGEMEYWLAVVYSGDKENPNIVSGVKDSNITAALSSLALLLQDKLDCHALANPIIENALFVAKGG